MNPFSISPSELTERCKQTLMKHYGDRLLQVIVFGSVAKPAAIGEFEQGTLQLYRNIQQEGIRL